MPEANTDHAARAARIRLTQRVAAATVVAACAGFAALVSTTAPGPAGADSAAHPTTQHAGHDGARVPQEATSPGRPGSATPAPAATPGTPTHRSAPVDTTAISTLAASGIPQVALNAYRVAAARLGHAEPTCGVQWYLLAGIGRVESDHGQFAGAVLHHDGISTPAIIGPALDGKGNQYIPAPPNGLALDGDATYAHALGPMQFIPSTWAGWGADANGDGKADIFNINDAALAAARYLCAAGGNLRQQAGQSRAVLAYNHLTSYRDEVLALADAYRRGITPTGALIGNTTGALPKTGHTGALPPATAGSPVATTTHRPTSSSAAHPARPSSGSGSGSKPTYRAPGTSKTSTRTRTHSSSPTTPCSSSPTSPSSSSTSPSTPPSSPSTTASTSPSCKPGTCCSAAPSTSGKTSPSSSGTSSHSKS